MGKKGQVREGGGRRHGAPAPDFLPSPWERKVVSSRSELAARWRARLGLEAAGPISVP